MNDEGNDELKSQESTAAPMRRTSLREVLAKLKAKDEARMKRKPPKGFWEPENEELDEEDELERLPFDEISSKYDLSHRLDGRENALLWRVWQAANAVKFLVSSPPPRHEDQITREEAHFVRLRKRLFSTKGWKQLPPEIKEDVEHSLLCGWEDPWYPPTEEAS